MPEFRMILDNYTTQIAMALERDRLMLESQTVRVEVETEQLRNTSAVFGIARFADTPGCHLRCIQQYPAESCDERRDTARVTADMFDESDRLSRLVENLLRLTQVTSGQFVVQKQWHPVEDIVGSSLRRLEHLLGRPARECESAV